MIMDKVPTRQARSNVCCSALAKRVVIGICAETVVEKLAKKTLVKGWCLPSIGSNSTVLACGKAQL